LRGVLLQWNDPKHTRNHRIRPAENQDSSILFNVLQVYGRTLANGRNRRPNPNPMPMIGMIPTATIRIGGGTGDRDILFPVLARRFPAPP
jgi:hypothetical protein